MLEKLLMMGIKGAVSRQVRDAIKKDNRAIKIAQGEVLKIRRVLAAREAVDRWLAEDYRRSLSIVRGYLQVEVMIEGGKPVMAPVRAPDHAKLCAKLGIQVPEPRELKQ